LSARVEITALRPCGAEKWTPELRAHASFVRRGRLIAKEGEDEICDQLREETIPAIWSGKVRKPIITLRKAATGVRTKADAQC